MGASYMSKSPGNKDVNRAEEDDHVSGRITLTWCSRALFWNILSSNDPTTWMKCSTLLRLGCEIMRGIKNNLLYVYTSKAKNSFVIMQFDHRKSTGYLACISQIPTQCSKLLLIHSQQQVNRTLKKPTRRENLEIKKTSHVHFFLIKSFLSMRKEVMNGKLGSQLRALRNVSAVYGITGISILILMSCGTSHYWSEIFSTQPTHLSPYVIH